MGKPDSPKTIVLKPRFTDGNFDGYEQIAGSHYFDTAGHLYGFVDLADFNRMGDRMSEALEVRDAVLRLCKALPKNLVATLSAAGGHGATEAEMLLKIMEATGGVRDE